MTKERKFAIILHYKHLQHGSNHWLQEASIWNKYLNMEQVYSMEQVSTAWNNYLQYGTSISTWNKELYRPAHSRLTLNEFFKNLK